MHSDIAALEVVCQHYKRHYEQVELRRLKNNVRRLHREIIRLKCELGIIRVLLLAWCQWERTQS